MTFTRLSPTLSGQRPFRAEALGLEWHIVSADGHPVGGSFVFFVGRAGAG